MASIVERWILKLADRYNPSCRSRLSRKADPFSHPHKKSNKFLESRSGPTSQRRPCESDSAAQTTSFFLWLYTKTRTPSPQFLTRGQTTQPTAETMRLAVCVTRLSTIRLGLRLQGESTDGVIPICVQSPTPAGVRLVVVVLELGVCSGHAGCPLSVSLSLYPVPRGTNRKSFAQRS